MEDFMYIVLLIAWVVISLYKRSAKAKQRSQQSQQSQPAQPKARPIETTALPTETSMEDMLEEFFGGGKKKPVPEVEETSYAEEAAAVQEYVLEYESPSYEQTQKALIPEGYEEPEYKSFFQDNTADDHADYAEVGKIASVEELIRSHAAKDAMEQARSEMEYGGGQQSDIPEFDLRTAVLFSEILNKKYA